MMLKAERQGGSTLKNSFKAELTTYWLRTKKAHGKSVVGSFVAVSNKDAGVIARLLLKRLELTDRADCFELVTSKKKVSFCVTFKD